MKDDDSLKTTKEEIAQTESMIGSAGISRKDFLKKAGVAGAALTAAALGGVTLVRGATKGRQRVSRVASMAPGWSPDDPLMPTGDSTTDTAALQAALHDPALDNGGTLYLGPGTFMIHRFIGRQDISDPSDPSYSTVLFNGTIQGAGKDVTILKGVRGPGGAGFGPLHYELPGFASDDHTLMAVIQTYASVKDLTFESESELVDPANAFGSKGLVNFLGLGTFVPGLNDLIGTDVVNVRFIGSLDSSGMPETPLHFQLWGDKGGVHNIRGCDFENNVWGAIQFYELSDAVVNIGGLPNEKVTLKNCIEAPVEVWGCNNLNVNASRLETQDSSGVAFGGNTNSRLGVFDCNIKQEPDANWAGVEIRNNANSDVVISNNSIHGEEAWLWGPIFSNTTDGVVVTNNRIEGNGGAGIYMISGANHFLKANNFNNFQVAPWGIAKIWLGYFDGRVTDSMIIGGNNRVNVYDSGYPGAGNIYTGVNNMHMKIGQKVKDAMNQKMQAKEAMLEQRRLLRRGGTP